MSFPNPDTLKGDLKEIVRDCLARGPGYAQEGVVLRLAKDAFRPQSLQEQQLILEIWHSLFAEGELAWGYNLDNPSSPFFHSTVSQAATAGGAR